MAWNAAVIAGTQAVVFEPRERARFAVLWLHGSDEALPDANGPLTELLEKHKLACVAPAGGQSWWLEMPGVVPWMLEHWTGIAIAGIEMGGQGAIRLALRNPTLFRVAAGLGSAIDFHELHGRGTAIDELFPSKERARQATAPLHLNPAEWPPHLWFACDPEDQWYRGNDRLMEKLRAYGVSHTADLDSSGSDYFQAMLPPMIDFLADGLERESRRLM
jgi:hypothetical protein